jgi:hypothetical protein
MKTSYNTFEEAVGDAKKCLSINDPIYYVRQFSREEEWYIESGKEYPDESGEKLDLEDFLIGDSNANEDNEVVEVYDIKQFDEGDNPMWVQEILLYKLSHQENEYAIVYNYGDGREVLDYQNGWNRAYESFEKECKDLEEELISREENEEINEWLRMKE